MPSWRWTTKTLEMDATNYGRVHDRVLRKLVDPYDIVRIQALKGLESSQEAFDRQRDPETGRPWPKLRPNTIAAKGHSRILFRTGRLERSFRRGGPGNVFQIRRRSAVVGSRLRTAAIAQHGTRAHPIRPRRKKFLRFVTTGGIVFSKGVLHPGTPPRPVIGMTKAKAKELATTVARYLDKLIAGKGA